MHFDDIVDTYINKNSDVLNIPKNSLCPYLFSFQEGTPPVLLESVRLQLLNGMERIGPYIKVLKYLLTGECLHPSSDPSKTSDVSVVISFAAYTNDSTTQYKAYQMSKKLSGQYVDRTQHKVYYYLYDTPLNISNLDSAFDILNNKWLKVPEIHDEDFDTDN